LINVAIVGVGNCASALVQGVNYYRGHQKNVPGVMFTNIGGYRPWNIAFVAAWDVDVRKVGKCLRDAIFAQPNCARIFERDMTDDAVITKVRRGPVLDGVSDHMRDYHIDINFQVDKNAKEDTKEEIIAELKRTKVDVILNYLPVGSQKATEFWMEAAIEAGIAVVNCIPVFIASDKKWEKKFIEAGLPMIGDDMRSQVGASIVSQVLQELAYDRGARVKFHQQLNVGGNSDFANMMNPERIVSKKISKENVIRSQNDIREIPVEKDSLFAGPSSFVPYLKDKKVAYFRIELESFGGSEINLDVKLEVQDSENSAGVVIDAIRFLQVAREMGIVGALRGPSAFTQKTPPEQMMYRDALYECEMLAKREFTEATWKQVQAK
jgi:myo-inositol-1-phosphate synthase